MWELEEIPKRTWVQSWSMELRPDAEVWPRVENRTRVLLTPRAIRVGATTCVSVRPGTWATPATTCATSTRVRAIPRAPVTRRPSMGTRVSVTLRFWVENTARRRHINHVLLTGGVTPSVGHVSAMPVKDSTRTATRRRANVDAKIITINLPNLTSVWPVSVSPWDPKVSFVIRRRGLVIAKMVSVVSSVTHVLTSLLRSRKMVARWAWLNFHFYWCNIYSIDYEDTMTKCQFNQGGL